jgi:hypothetical protein
VQSINPDRENDLSPAASANREPVWQGNRGKVGSNQNMQHELINLSRGNDSAPGNMNRIFPGTIEP